MRIDAILGRYGAAGKREYELATHSPIREEAAGRLGERESMEITAPYARPFVRRSAVLPSLGGAALLALAFYAAVLLLQPILAAVAGAGGLALLRWARAERPYSPLAGRPIAAQYGVYAHSCGYNSATVPRAAIR